MKKFLVSAITCGLFIIASNSFVKAEEAANLTNTNDSDVAEQAEHKNWMDHVLQNYDINWELNETYSSGDQCVIDNFDDGTLEPKWLGYNDPGITVSESGGTARIYGITPWHYSGGSISLKDAVPVQSFDAKVDVLAASGAFGGEMHRGEHFTFVASGNNGHYVALQYWADAYRISWDNGGGWNRIYSNSNGNEMTTWYTWKITYNAYTKEAKVYVNDRQIGGSADVDLGTTFRIGYSVIATTNTWIEGILDNFSLCYAATDTTPPVITINSVSPQILWPPDGKTVNVNIDGSAIDSGSGISSITIDTIDEYGRVQPSRSGFGPVPLESWRDGKDKDGRRYTLKITATDNAGNVAIKYLRAIVPHDVGVHCLTCNTEPEGVLSGIGGDGQRYTASWSGTGTLAPVPYEYNGQPFFHFTLNNIAWPDSEWGIERTSWSATCTKGGELSGIGGDGQRYTASWSGTGTLAPVPYEYNGQPFFHFTLNNMAWPNSEWGIEQTSWSLTCIQ